MAQSIGSKIQGALVGILIALLVLAFAVWGINDVFSPSSKDAVVSLGGNEVSTAEFDTQFRRELSVLARTEGRQLPHQEAYDRGIHRQVIQQLTTSKVIEIDADDLGIGVNTRSAIDYVSDIEAFQDELTGKFSESKMEEILAMQRPPISRQQFEKTLVQDLRQQQTIPAINGGVVAPLEFAQQRYQYLTEQRKASVLTFDQRAIEEPPLPTDEELKTYIAENPLRFTAPEYRRVTLIRLETTDITPDLEVTDVELEEFFQLKVDLGELGSAETRSVVQLTARDEETAKQAAERLANGEDASDVAVLLNLIEPTTYENVVEDAILDPETGKTAFELAEGNSKAILGSLGNWYAVGVTKVTPADRPTLADIRDELTKELLESKATEKLFEITPTIENILDEGGTIEEAAEAAEVPYATIDYIDRSGTTQDGKKLSGFELRKGIAEDEAILKEIFTNDMGYPTDLFQTSSGGWAALRIDEIIESKVREFGDVRQQAAALWTQGKTNEALDERMRDLAQSARDGKTLETLQTEIGDGAALEDIVLLRSSRSERVGPGLTAELLDGSIGDVVRGSGPRPLTRQIAILTDIIESNDGLAGQYADLLQDQATAAIRSDLNNAYQQAILAENPYQEFPDKIRRTLGLDTEE